MNDNNKVCKFISGAAKKYHNYLSEHNKGINIVKAKSVIRRSNYEFIIYFDGKITDFDFVTEIQFDEKVVAISNFRISSATPDYVKIIALEKHIPLLTESKSINIIVDFKQLVWRIYKKFESNNRISLPQKPSIINFNKEAFPDATFSDVQLKAINNIFSSPISYVWGAAGSGKTRYVLAYSILTYLKNDLSVLLCAPTNIALENALSAIIPIAQSQGIPLNYIFRAGTPSDDFAKKYPDCCKDKGLSKKLNKLLKKQNDLLKFISIKEHLSELSYIYELLNSSEIYNKQHEDLKNDNDSLTLRANLLRKQLSDEKIQLKETNFIINDLNRKKRSPIYKLKVKFGIAAKYETKYNEFLTILDDINKSIQKDEMEIAGIQKTVDENEDKIKSLNKLINKTNSSISKKIATIANGYADISNPTLMKREIDSYREKSELFFKYVVEEYKNVNFENFDEVKSIAENTKSELESLIKKSDINTKEISLYACTLDYLTFPSIISTENFSHVFLDEACYSSIAKTSLLFYESCPITFLGDHMQLPPVSEINDSDLNNPDNKDMFIWSQNGIYASELFTSDFDVCFRKYIDNNNELPKEISVSKLNVTHRFGIKLSEILDKFVYKCGFKSALSTETKITVINAPKMTICSKSRENADEANTIKQFLQNNTLDDFIILTPYVNQVNLIKRTLPQKFRDKVLTIHKSQGQEWDTVILSVSDTDNKFFTDVNNTVSRGKQLLNTAISRTKKELILVCDTNYWELSDKQLISELIKIGVKHN